MLQTNGSDKVHSLNNPNNNGNRNNIKCTNTYENNNTLFNAQQSMEQVTRDTTLKLNVRLPGSKYLIIEEPLNSTRQQLSAFFKRVISNIGNRKVEICKKTCSGVIFIKAKNDKQAVKSCQHRFNKHYP